MRFANTGRYGSPPGGGLPLSHMGARMSRPHHMAPSLDPAHAAELEAGPRRVSGPAALQVLSKPLCRRLSVRERSPPARCLLASCRASRWSLQALRVLRSVGVLARERVLRSVGTLARSEKRHCVLLLLRATAGLSDLGMLHSDSFGRTLHAPPIPPPRCPTCRPTMHVRR